MQKRKRAFGQRWCSCSRAREERERGVVYLGGDGGDPRSFRSIGQKSLPLLDASSWRRFGALDTPKKEVQKISRPDAKSSPSSSREATVRAKKALSFHLVPRRRVFPAGFSVDRPRARPWDASTIAFFGLINSRFSRARAITRPPDQSHFSLTSLDRERKRERHTEREKRPPKPAKETTQKERERERRLLLLLLLLYSP